jgi:hypothetical protein
MKTTSKIIQGSEIEDFSIIQGHLYIRRNSDVVVMANQERIDSQQFKGIIVSGNLDGWGLGHYSSVWDREDFKPFEGIIQIEQVKNK